MAAGLLSMSREAGGPHMMIQPEDSLQSHGQNAPNAAVLHYWRGVAHLVAAMNGCRGYLVNEDLDLGDSF